MRLKIYLFILLMIQPVLAETQCVSVALSKITQTKYMFFSKDVFELWVLNAANEGLGVESDEYSTLCIEDSNIKISNGNAWATVKASGCVFLESKELKCNSGTYEFFPMLDHDSILKLTGNQPLKNMKPMNETDS